MGKQSYQQPPKSQWWSSIIYPNENITIEYINRVVIKMHLPCIISPLHDRDSIEGYPIRIGLQKEIIEDIWKKPHYHIMFMFPRAVSRKSFDYIKEKFEEYGIIFVGSEMVLNGVSMARYFAHLDNPEKHQYSIHDILYYGGLNPSILKIDKLNSVQQDKIRHTVVQAIINNKLIDVIDAYLYFESIGDDMLAEYVIKNSAMVEKFVRANYYRYNPRVPPRQKHEAITCNMY